MKLRNSNRLLAGILSLAMLCNISLMPVLAAEAAGAGCPHHIHDSRCTGAEDCTICSPKDSAPVEDEADEPFPLLKSAMPAFMDARLPEKSAVDYTLGGKPGDYLYLVYDRGDRGVSYPGLATLEVFRDDTASGNWKSQYFDRNSSGVSLFFTLNGKEMHYVTPYYSVWNNSTGILLKDSDAVVRKINENTISVRWINGIFVLEMQYSYKPGTLSLQREFRLTNMSTEEMTDIRLVYGGDTYFGGNDYGHSYWDDAQNMVYVRSAESGATFMGLSGGAATPATAYFGGDSSEGLMAADNGDLPSTVTSANEDQSYYLQWERQYISSRETYAVTATERFSIGGAVQLMSPENQTVENLKEEAVLTYTFLALNLDSSPAQCDITAVSSRGYKLEVNPVSLSMGGNGQRQFTVKVTIPKDAQAGDDKITVTATVPGTGAVSRAFVITGISKLTDKTPPVISELSYAKNTNWVNTSETVSFAVDDENLGYAWVMVAHADGRSVPVTQKTDRTFSFVATETGIYTITAQDTAGNMAIPVFTKQINVDTKPPVLSDIQISPRGTTTGYTSILNTGSYSFFTHVSSDITLTLADGGSGIKKLEYQFVTDGGVIDENGWETRNFLNAPLNHTVVLPANKLPFFAGSLAVRITDGVGNVYTSSPAANGRFVMDSTAPEVNLSITASGFDPAKWHSSLEVTATAKDDGSGLAKLTVIGGPTLKSISPRGAPNGLGAITYGDSAMLTTPGVYTMYATAVDKSGNQAQSAALQTVKICSRPPVLNLSSSAEEGYTSNEVTLTLWNSDTQVYSDVTYYYKKSTDSSYTKITTAAPDRSVTLVLAEEGGNLYDFKAVSETGVESAVQSHLVQIDRGAPPVPEVRLNPEAPDGTYCWYKTRPAIRIIPAPGDGASTVSTLYKLAPAANFNYAPPQQYTGTPPTITSEGIYILEVYAQDGAGNISASRRLNILVDTTAPVLDTLTINGAPAPAADGVFYTDSSANITATFSDAGSGPYQLLYQLVPDGQEMNQTGNFTPCTLLGGQYRLTVAPQFSGRAYLIGVDKAGNRAVLAKPRLAVDALAPTAPAVDTGSYTPGAWTFDAVTLRITEGSSTAVSGIAGYFYTIEGDAAEHHYTGPFAAPESTVTTYHFYAKSNTGAKSPATTVTVMHDNTIPTILATSNTTVPTDKDVTLTVSTDFGLSGMKSVSMRVNNGAWVDISHRFASSAKAEIKVTANSDYLFEAINAAGMYSQTFLTISNINKAKPAMPGVSVTPGATAALGLAPWLNTSQSVVLTAPAGSNDTVFYKLYPEGGSAPEGWEYSSPLPVSVDGKYILEAYTQNTAGNTSPPVKRVLWLDQAVPTLTMAPKAGSSPFTDSVDYVFTVTDTGSGPQLVRYTLTEGGTSRTGYLPLAGGSATLHLEGDFHGTLTAQGYDMAGNASAEKSADVVVNGSGPRTAAIATGPVGYAGAWTNGDVTIRLSVSGLEGFTNPVVSRYEYSVDNGASWATATSNISAADNTAEYIINTEVGSKNYLFHAVISHGAGGAQTTTTSASLPVLVRIDKSKPLVQSISFEGGQTVFGGAAEVTVECADGFSGIQRVEYSLNGADFTPYTGPFSVLPQFDGTVTVRAVDVAGNTTQAASSRLIVDGLTPAPPTLAAENADGSSYAGNRFTSQNVTVTATGGGLTGGTAFSGVDSYEYSTDYGKNYRPMPPAGAVFNDTGVTSVWVRTVSVAGNRSEPAEFVVKLDKNSIRPTVTHKNRTGNAVEPDVWANEDVFTTVSAQGYLMPVRYEYKKSTDTDWTGMPTGGLPLAIRADAPVSYNYRMLDDAGDVLTTDFVTYNQDRVPPPEAQAMVGGAPIGSGWYNIAANGIAVSVPPDSSGGSPIESVQYALHAPGSVPSFQPYNIPLNSPGDGVWLLSLLTVDKAGNKTYSEPCAIKQDTAAPRVFIEIPHAPVLAPLYAEAIQITLSATDDISGVAELEYKLVKEGESFSATDWLPYTGPLQILTSQKGTVYARAKDHAGNQSNDTQAGAEQRAFTVDLEKLPAPRLLAAMPSGSYTPAAWAGENVTLSVQGIASVSLSGIQKYEYRQSRDGGARWTNWDAMTEAAGVWKAPELAEDGQFVYEVRAVSGTGRAGYAASYTVWRDAGGVTLNVAAKLPNGAAYNNGDWTNQTVRYTLSANAGQNTSGLLFYEGDAGGRTLISNVVEVVGDTGQAGKSFTFWAGNRAVPQGLSASKTVTARVDKKPPATPDISVGYLPATEQNGWYNAVNAAAAFPGIIVRFDAEPGGEGSPVTNWIDLGGGWTTYSNTPPEFPRVDGTFTYRVKASDDARNQSGVDSLTLRVDTAPPSGITAVFYNAAGQALLPNSEGEILSGSVVHAKLTGADSTSGMASITWETAGAAGSTAPVEQAVDASSSVSVPIPIGFSGTLSAKGKDQAKNESADNLYTSPVLRTQNASNTAVEASTLTPPAIGNWYKDSVTLTAYAQNTKDGLSRVVVKINNLVKAEERYTDLPKNKKALQVQVTESRRNNTVEIIAYDSFGNATSQKYFINIDNTTPAAPVVKKELYNPSYVPPLGARPGAPKPGPDENGFVGGKKTYGGEWTNHPVHFSFAGGAAIPSGILRIEYAASHNGKTGWTDWAPISGQAEKAHRVGGDTNLYYRFRYISNVGNEGLPTEPIRARVDTLAPAPATVSIAGQGGSGVYRGSPVITVTLPSHNPATESPVLARLTLRGSGYFLDAAVAGDAAQQAGAALQGIARPALLSALPERSPYVIRSLPIGSYTLTVETYDEAGNRSGNPQSLVFQVVSGGGSGGGGGSGSAPETPQVYAVPEPPEAVARPAIHVGGNSAGPAKPGDVLSPVTPDESVTAAAPDRGAIPEKAPGGESKDSTAPAPTPPAASGGRPQLGWWLLGGLSACGALAAAFFARRLRAGRQR